MKIISKYKDYYDFLVGLYGEDDKLILDRRNGHVINRPSEVFHLHIGGKKIEGVFLNGIYYYGEDLELIAGPRDDRPYHDRREDFKDCIRYYSTERTKYNQTVEYDICKYIKDSPKNSLLKCPIIYSGGLKFEKKDVLFPKLENFKLAKILPPKDIWILLSSFIASSIVEPVVPIGSDKVRIESHGFDIKTSFRK